MNGITPAAEHVPRVGLGERSGADRRNAGILLNAQVVIFSLATSFGEGERLASQASHTRSPGGCHSMASR
jgi:hypothetical protein